MGFSAFRRSFFCAVFCAFLAALTAAQKVIIDDQNGDESTGQLPIYTPSANWAQGAECTGCLLKPDPADALDGTWHDSTYDPTQQQRPGIPSFTLLFDGSSISIYCIKADYVEWATTNMQLDFFLDGKQVGQYTYTPDNLTTSYTYNVLVYDGSMASGSHNLTVQSFGTLLFDYATYTPLEVIASLPPLSSSPSSSSSSSAATQSSLSISRDTLTSISTTTGLKSSSSTTTTQSIASNTVNPSSPSSASASSSQAPTTGQPLSNTAQTLSAASTSTSQPTNSVAPDAGESETRSHSHVGAIVGGIVGGLVVLATCVGFLLWRRLRRAARQGHEVIRPFGQADEYERPITSTSYPSDSSSSTQPDMRLASSDILTSLIPSASATTSSHPATQTIEASTSSVERLQKARDRASTVVSQQTQQEIQEHVRDTQARINVLRSSSTFQEQRVQDEVAMLRAYVAQLETELYTPWANIRPDEPPPEY